tara:strand:+ start:322 stop:474 length:153 start_codon:yes stop_codon:yes gene_type:complete
LLIKIKKIAVLGNKYLIFFVNKAILFVDKAILNDAEFFDKKIQKVDKLES